MSRWLILSSLTLSSGTGIRLKGIAKGLAHCGYEVWLVGEGERDHSIVGMSYVQVQGSVHPVVAALRLFFANLVTVIRIHPRYCIASKPLPHAVVPALLARWLGAVTFLDFDDLESGYWQNRPFQPLLRFLERISPRLFHFTCVHTKELANETVERAKVSSHRVLRLNQGVDVELFSSTEVEDEPVRPVILYAAHLGVAAKGLNFVLQGFRSLAEQRLPFILLVVGGGPLLPLFQEEAKRLGLNGRVVFAGQMDHRCMPKIMRLARAAVNYLEPENSANRYRASVKVREYLCAGLPVASNIVGSDLNNFAKFLEVFEDGDLESFIQAVGQALERGVRQDAQEELRKNWAWEVVVGTFLSEIRRLRLPYQE